MIQALLLLSSLAYAQTKDTVNTFEQSPSSSTIATVEPQQFSDANARLENVEVLVRGLQSGRQNITGVPNYQNGFTSSGSVTMNGQTAINNATIAAGSINGASTVFRSTFTSFTSVSVTNADLRTCVVGTTVTFTPTSSAVDIIYAGTVSNGNSGDPCAVGILLDGGYLPGYSNLIGFSVGVNGYNQDASFVFPSAAITPNIAHSACLLASCTGSAAIALCANSASFDSRCKFGMREAY